MAESVTGQEVRIKPKRYASGLYEQEYEPSPPRLMATQSQSVTGCSINLERPYTSLFEYAHRRTGGDIPVRWRIYSYRSASMGLSKDAFRAG